MGKTASTPKPKNTSENASAATLERTIPAGHFKDVCLQLIDEVYRDGIAVVVTKRGKPLVRVVPVCETPATTDLRGTVLREDDDIFSTGEEWEAER